MNTIENKVAREILEQPDSIKIGEKSYDFYPPSTATLILASQTISQLPAIKLDADDIASESLSVAKDCKVIGDIIAILLLGAKHLTEEKQTTRTKQIRLLGGLIKWNKEIKEIETIDRKAELSKKLLEDLTPRDLQALASQLLSRMQIADFFALTTFLTEVNLLRQTKVEN